MLNQKEAVNEVLSLYEEIENLKREKEELLREKKNSEESNSLTDKLARCGRNMLAKQYADTWRDVFAIRTKNGGIRFEPSSFEEWVSRKLDRLETPSSMSREDIFNALHDELSEIYCMERGEAMKLLLEKEAEAKEEAE